MSETTKIFVPEGGNNDLATIAAMNNGGLGGSFNNPFWAIILLAFLRNGFGFGGNGFGGQCTQDLQLQAIREQLTTNQNSTLLMDAIKGNASAISALATNLNLSKDTMLAAVNGVQGQISNLGAQMGMNNLQVINAINAGNTSLANQLSSCCCDLKQLVTAQGYENQLATLNQTNVLQQAINSNTIGQERGFSQIGYQMATDTCAVKQNATDNTGRILAKLDQIEDSRKDREIASLTAALTAANSRAERAAEIAPILKQLEEIKGKQPSVATIPYPNLVGIPASQLYGLGAYGLNPNGQWS